MNTSKPIHPEWLSIFITRFRHWNQIGFKIHIEPDGSYHGALEVKP